LQSGGWIFLAKGGTQWRTVVNMPTVMNICVLQGIGNFITFLSGDAQFFGGKTPLPL
jgi:hypothetical protein